MTSMPVPNVGGCCAGPWARSAGAPRSGIRTTAARRTRLGVPLRRRDANADARAGDLHLELRPLDLRQAGVDDAVAGGEVRRQLLEGFAHTHRGEGALEDAPGLLREAREHVLVGLPVLERDGPLFVEY